LRVFLPTIDSRNIGLDGIRSYWFISLSYNDCRIGRLKAFAKDGIERHPCILGGDLESLLDDVGWKPNLPKQDYWNQRAIAFLANTLFTVMEPVTMPLLSSMLLLQF
jgi:hypothetical protein